MSQIIGGEAGAVVLRKYSRTDSGFVDDELTRQPTRIVDRAPVNTLTFTPSGMLDDLEPPWSAATGATNIEALQQQIRDKDARARELGIQLAKTQFFNRLFMATLATGGLAISIAACVATGGATAPVLALAAYTWVRAISDASCALYNWQSKQGGGEGLAMGGDSVANLVFYVATAFGVSEDRSRSAAKVISKVETITRVGSSIITAGLIVPTGTELEVAAIWFERVRSIVSEGVGWYMESRMQRNGDRAHNNELDKRYLEGRLDAWSMTT